MGKRHEKQSLEDLCINTTAGLYLLIQSVVTINTTVSLTLCDNTILGLCWLVRSTCTLWLGDVDGSLRPM